MRRRRTCVSTPMTLIAALALGAPLFGCDETQVRTERFRIAVHALEYPEPVITSAQDSVLVRATVGYGNCELEDGSVELHGDSLVVDGVARCRFVLESVNKITTPPEEPTFESFRLPFPTLVPGRYVLVAGDLADTLTVVPATVPPQTLRLAARGHTYSADSCAVFATFVSTEYELAETDPPRFGQSVWLYATFAGDPVCNPERFEARVLPRRIELTP